MKKLIIGMLFCTVGFWSAPAQNPKWVDKAKRAVFSIITYDAQDKILNTGNGFFISDDGVALSDYSLFKGAHKAVVLTSAGKQMTVDAILGANELYDVIRFRVATDGKKVDALKVAQNSPSANVGFYLLPYSTRKDRSFMNGTIKQVDPVADNYQYYTLNLHLQDKMVSCPVVTAEGDVFGLAQKSSGQDTATICYAVDARFAQQQHISALSYNDGSLRSIGIKKALPDTEEQALVFLYMVASQVTPEVYGGLLEDFIQQYPTSADGYLRRATHKLSQATDENGMKAVVRDLDQALAVSKKKDDVYYNRAKMIYSYLLAKPDNTFKAWTFDGALEEIGKAIAMNPLPIYYQLDGDIRFAKQDYAGALASYERLNQTNLKSAANFFSIVRTKEMLKAPQEEVLALMDSCLAQFTKPYTDAAAPYLLERAQRRVNGGKARLAVLDYDDYFKAVNGKVNDAYYYYHEQAALQAKQFQRALNDMAKAIELAPKELTYRAELAVLNLRVGRNEEALKVLNEALAIDPNYAEAYRLKGVVYIQLKQSQKACSCFAKAKKMGDEHVDELIRKHCK
ncbi:tetratricopeptide repeat family protein [gut metagenome]|uniref:Tetratricopeptide repeat family protein n=1 Tax=gut metagenome TaxID=749906 RepID=J9FKA2_9ZZZZ